LESEFLPFMDEGGFVLDYHAPWGTSLSETDRQLRQAETILRTLPELEVIHGAPARGWLWVFHKRTRVTFGQIKIEAPAEKPMRSLPIYASN